MRKLLILLFLTTTVAFSQTESETLNFINSKLRSCSDTFPDINGNEIPAIWSFKKDRSSYANIFNVSLDIGEPFQKFTLNPKNIIDIVEVKGGTLGNLNLKIISKDNSIQSWMVSDGNKNYVSELKLVLVCPSNGEVSRLKKALIHLFELNGASFADDDLFRN